MIVAGGDGRKDHAERVFVKVLKAREGGHSGENSAGLKTYGGERRGQNPRMRSRATELEPREGTSARGEVSGEGNWGQQG